MLCDRVQKQIVPYFLGELTDSKQKEIKSHIQSCATCRREYESYEKIWHKLAEMPEEKPSDELALKFNTMLTAYQRGLRESQNSSRIAVEWLKSAHAKPAFQLGFAVVLLIVGFMLGLAFDSGSSKKDYTQLSNELDDMRQLVMLSMLKQQSPADRLQAVNYSYKVKQPREDIRDALQFTLDNDPNTNVRLAALRALQPYAHDARVRRKIIDSFTHQRSPLVQIEIVDFVRQTETRPAEMLQILQQEDNLNQAVRQHINWTVGTLRGDTFIKETKNENIQY